MVTPTARSHCHNQFKLVLIEFYVNMKSVKPVKSRPIPTIAAAAGDQDVRRRGLSRAWAEGVQTVERVLAAVPWRGERVAALRVPAVDVATVPDAAFWALCLLRLLNIYKHMHRLYEMHTSVSNGCINTIQIHANPLLTTSSSPLSFFSLHLFSCSIPSLLLALHLSDPSLCMSTVETCLCS